MSLTVRRRFQFLCRSPGVSSLDAEGRIDMHNMAAPEIPGVTTNRDTHRAETFLLTAAIGIGAHGDRCTGRGETLRMSTVSDHRKQTHPVVHRSLSCLPAWRALSRAVYRCCCCCCCPLLSRLSSCGVELTRHDL